MNAKTRTLLLHPLFLLSLFLLLLNDLYLKYEYHNYFTGKLSDFTGIFAFFIFFRAIFPYHRKRILIVISLFFLWWKSPLSSPFIDFTNAVLHIPISRIIDYTDYIALAILPLAYYLQPIQYTPTFLRRASIGFIGLLSFFAFTATSLARKATDDGRISLNKRIRVVKTQKEIIERLINTGLEVKEDSAFEREYVYRAYLKTKDSLGKTIYLPLLKKYEGIYSKVTGDVYSISEMRVGKDTIYDVQVVINEANNNRNDFTILSFRHRHLDTSGMYFSNDAYNMWSRLKKPIKRRFKEIIKK